MNLSQYKEKLQQGKGKVYHLKDRHASAVAEEVELLKTRDNLEQAQVFLQKVAQDTQNQLKYHIEDIVQMGLDTMWPGEVEFKVMFELSRGKTEARLVFMVDGEEVDPLEADGGGLVNISSFALRIAAWSLGRTRNTIVLDEAFGNVSDDLQPAAAELIKELSDKLGIQFIVVTHRKEMYGVADKIFEVSRKRVGEFYESEAKVK